MLEPVGIEAVDDRAEKGRPRGSGQAIDEQIRCQRRTHERGKEQNVVGDDRMQSGRAQRDGHGRRDEHRVGERKRERLRIEDVAAEKRPWIAAPLLVDPAHSPHRKEGIAKIRDGVHVLELWPQEDGADDEDAECRERGARPPGPCWHVHDIGGGLKQSRPPRLPSASLDAKRTNGAAPPPADGEHDRCRQQRPVRVARRQANAADLGVEAAGPGHQDRRHRQRQREPVEGDRYPRPQPDLRADNRVSDISWRRPAGTAS